MRGVQRSIAWLVAGMLLGCSGSGSTDTPPVAALSQGAEAAVVAALRDGRAEVESAPRSASAWGRYADLLADNGFGPEAILCYRKAHELDRAAFAWVYRLGVQLAKVDVHAARARFEEALVLDASYAPLQVRLGTLLAECGEFAAAADHFERAVDLDPELVDAYLNHGQALLAQGQQAAAVEKLEQVLERAPYHFKAHTALAQAYYALGERDRAAEHASVARKFTAQKDMNDPRARPDVAPVSAKGLFLRALERAQQGDYEAARTDLERSIERDPGSSNARVSLATVLQKMGKPSEAESMALQTLTLFPDDVESHLLLATMYSNQRRLNLALDHCYRALRVDPQNATVLCTLGSLYARQGKGELAEEEYRKALQVDPAAPVAHYNLGILLADRGESQGLFHLTQAVRIDPDFWQGHQRLGMLQAENGLLEEALRSFQRVCELQPEYVDAQLEYGIILGRLQRPREALQHFRRIQAQFPEHAGLQQNLRSAVLNVAWRLATDPDDSRRDGPEALRLLQETFPDPDALDARSLDVFAAVQAENGDFEAAVASQQRALARLEPGESGTRRRLERRLRSYEESRPHRTADGD